MQILKDPEGLEEKVKETNTTRMMTDTKVVLESTLETKHKDGQRDSIK
jgi:hypothetical protein